MKFQHPTSNIQGSCQHPGSRLDCSPRDSEKDCGERPWRCEYFRHSGRGQPHSKTLSRGRGPNHLRQVLECGCPVPLSASPSSHVLTNSGSTEEVCSFDRARSRIEIRGQGRGRAGKGFPRKGEHAFTLIEMVISGAVAGLIVLMLHGALPSMRARMRRWAQQVHATCATGRLQLWEPTAGDIGRQRFPYGLAIACGALISVLVNQP